MPHRRSPIARANTSSSRKTFRKRYGELEAQRAALLSRLRMLGENGRKHPGYKRARKLINDTYRKSKMTQRLAVLQAASWLIDILEQFTPIV